MKGLSGLGALQEVHQWSRSEMVIDILEKSP
jgi:hypothetical protein